MRAKVIVVLTFLLFSASSALAGTETVLYSFAGGTDGSGPYQAGVVFDQSGNLYGVTYYGGLYGNGTVFQLTPSGGGWTENTLYNFTGSSDGANPAGGLLIDGSGNLYGTTWGGGTYQCGVVFRLSPSQGGWTYSVLYAFTGNDDGEAPQGDLMFLSSTDIVGTTSSAGWQCHIGNGTVFIVTTWGTLPEVGCFTRGSGSVPGGVGICDHEICGTTEWGGKEGMGSLFRWNTNNKSVGTMYTFKPTEKTGVFPFGDLTSNAELVVFGTTYAGGVGGYGTVYQLTPSFGGGGRVGWHSTVLHSFTGANGDGGWPWAGVILDAAGNIYGTTTIGGSDPGSAGTVFRLTPGPKNKWNETVLYSFSGGADGGDPTGALIFDSAGNIYGTTQKGGAYGQGTVYMVTP